MADITLEHLTPDVTAQSNTDAILLAILAELRMVRLGNTPPMVPGEVELKEPAGRRAKQTK